MMDRLLNPLRFAMASTTVKTGQMRQRIIVKPQLARPYLTYFAIPALLVTVFSVF
jgi:hypothetical protein